MEPQSQLGKYTIIRKIGVGGMADVYEAEDTALYRRVALKVLPYEFARDQERVQRFEKEVRAAASLTHAHIVTLYDVGEDQGCHYYSM
jgi:serine/threonine protein kinase